MITNKRSPGGRRSDAPRALTAAFAVTLALALAGGDDAVAQSTRPTIPPVTPVAPVRATPPVSARDTPPIATTDDEETPTERPRHAPLLREGSHLVRVRGRLRHAPADGTWIFVVDAAPRRDAPPHELIVMPGTLLGELERMLESADSAGLVFEVTGEAYVYQDRNFLMLTHPALLIGQDPEDDADGQAGNDDGDDADETDDIIRELERAVGPLARRPTIERGRAIGETAGGHDASLVAEGTTLLTRRGRIRRTGAGSFMFVFDADAEGLADPPMLLLPCLLLEQLEAFARRAEERTPVLLSGRVFTYRGQNYLMPAVFRIPRERTMLNP